MKRSRKKNPTKNRLHSKVDPRLPFIEHFYELRRRLFYIALSVIGVSLLAYTVQQHLVNILLAPSKGQHFIYTSPGGGLDFLFRVCIYTGIAVSIPVIIYQFLHYLEPLMKDTATSRFIMTGSIVSGVFALLGIVFGYFIGLPNVLHFLFHQFTNKQIQPLVTVQSYISFVTLYMLGSALLLQVPLILIFINRIKPLSPRGLFRKERWLILGAFVVSGLMNPTLNVFSQLLVAGPIIIMYQVGIFIIWRINRRSRHSPQIAALLEQDAATQSARMQVPRKLEPFEPLSAAFRSPDTLHQSPVNSATDRASVRRPIERQLYYTDVRSEYSGLPQTE